MVFSFSSRESIPLFSAILLANLNYFHLADLHKHVVAFIKLSFQICWFSACLSASAIFARKGCDHKTSCICLIYFSSSSHKQLISAKSGVLQVSVNYIFHWCFISTESSCTQIVINFLLNSSYFSNNLFSCMFTVDIFFSHVKDSKHC